MSGKRQYLVSRTYEETTPESVMDGDTSDNGFIYENSVMDLSDILRELRDCVFLSESPIKSQTDVRGVWASTEYYTVDYADGTERQESVHINKYADGTDIPSRNLYRIYKLAGLVS
jgi:hypothetical protein